MERKRKLKNRKEWVEENLTWKERRAKWLLRREAERLSVEKRRIKIGYMKMWINGKEWIWNERERRLKDKAGERRGRKEENWRERTVERK